MNLLIRVVFSVICVCVLLFCCFGFLATFEPLDHAVQLTWRLIYGAVGVVAVAGIVFVNRGKNGD